jgi:hypothetical protein
LTLYPVNPPGVLPTRPLASVATGRQRGASRGPILSDKRSPRLADLDTAKQILDRMIAFMNSQGLAPNAGDN